MKKELLFRKAFLLLLGSLDLLFSFVLGKKTKQWKSTINKKQFAPLAFLPSSFVFKKPAIATMVALFLFSMGVQHGFGQTATQNFGTGSNSNTLQTAVTNLFPNPTGSGTTYARGGATAPNAPIVLANTSNPLGTAGSYIRAVASSSTSVSKVSPIVGYTGSTEFYTSFKVLFGDASGGNVPTITSGSYGTWTLSQGAGSYYSDNTSYTPSQTFTALRFAYGASGAITLSYDNNGTFGSSGLTSTALTQGTVYTIEIVGNNKTSGTISYTYNGVAQTVAVQKYDLYINGNLVGNDLTKATLAANTAISGISFSSISSTNNAANLFIDDVVVYNAVPATIGAPLVNPPTLTAAANATVDAPFDVTFTDDATWRAAISSISVGGTTLSASAYAVSAGKITFTPSAATLLQAAGAKSVVVFATGYNNATVTQTIGAGAANKLSMNTQPTAPTANGGTLVTQPKVTILDQYGNATTSTAAITAAVGAGTWTIGGTTTVSASAGLATFTNLTATSAAAVTGATITFSSTGLTGVTSGTFNIPAPPPVNDNCSNATVLTVNGGTLPGTMIAATSAANSFQYGTAFPDVWYKFVPTVTASHTVTMTFTAGTGKDIDLDVFTTSVNGSCPTSGTAANISHTTNPSEIVTNTLTAGVTYYVRVIDAGSANGGDFTIRVTTPVPQPTLIAASPATVDAPFDVTFTDNPAWREAITGITIGGTTLTGGYTVSPGKITFTPSASNPTTLLQSAGAKTIVVSATNYSQASVIQTIGVGVPVKLVISTQPTAPASNGAVLATQPKVNVTDQYGNVVTTSTATVTATVGAGAWVIGGTTAVNAASGAVTYSGLTASSLAAVTGATITFTSPGLTSVTSTAFNIAAPTITAPVATAATNVNATSFTANWNAMPGATSYVIDVYTKTVQSNQTVAAWTFPTDGAVLSTDIYNSYNSGKLVSTTGGSITDSAGLTTQAPSANAWQSGSGTKYWQIDVNTTGASQMKLSSTQRSSGTGPRDFKAQYKAGAGNWTDITGATAISVAVDWTSGVLNNVTLPAECDNQSSVLIRWIMTSNTSVGGAAVASGGTNRIDDIYLRGDLVVNTYLVQNSNVGNVTSFTVTGLNPVATYYYVVRAVNGAVVSSNSNEIQVTTRPDTTIWDGNTWSNGAPALDMYAIVNGALSMTTSLEARSITVNSGGSVIVTTGKTLRVANEVNNATNDATKFIVESGASLIQNNAAAVNVGPITVKRNSYPLYLQDYTLWASPVANQNLRNFSPNTLYNRFYSYDTTIAPNGNWVQEIVTTADMNTKTFGLAKGYLIRMPNNWTAFSNLQTPGTVYPGVFVGVPNSGNITYTLSNANTQYNLVGNPYPSPISVASFRAANPGIGGTFYFYRKRNAAQGSGYGTLSQAGFAGNVSVSNFGLIEVGQGFFVKANGVSTLNFTNAMRAEASASAVFLRSTSAQATTTLTNDNPIEMNRFWLNLVKDNEQVGQALIGYMEGATLGVDEDFDAKYFNDSALALTSIINNQEYIIQARPVPFVATDVVPLGFKTDVAGTYTFALGNKEGIFADASQYPIYLKDYNTNTVHDLNTGAYTFTAQPGVYNTRFEILYYDSALAQPSFGMDNNVNVYKQNKAIVIDAGDTKLEKIEIWDTLGRLLFTTKTNETRYEVKQQLMENQVLLIKITTEKGSSNKKMHY
ncbi:hemoblobin-interacting domain-containing protein [Flavobacterium sp.]|uniref:hemoblobin-interacting domain-containing protein n=1 Tax=Flavobacterium sp. TaxID=239 RepID=UPI0025BCD43B|nr:hemoblobin-interacting domain-containing protein [Flavobacterium sp.]